MLEMGARVLFSHSGGKESQTIQETQQICMGGLLGEGKKRGLRRSLCHESGRRERVFSFMKGCRTQGVTIAGDVFCQDL